MVIDARVDPTFYSLINNDPARTEERHKQIGVWKNGTSTPDHTAAQMAIAGIDKLVLHATAISETESLVTNDEVAAIVASDPARYGGIGSVAPFASNAVEEAERAFGDLGLSGLYLSPSRGHYSPTDPRMDAIYETCARAGRPIVFASGLSWEPDTLAKYSRPIEFEEVAVRHPELRFCLTQFGWPWVTEAVMLALKYPNVHLDTGMLYSGSAREWYKRIFTEDVDAKWIDRSIRHQVMYASGSPRFEQIRMMTAIDELPLRESTKELIKGTNAEAFFFGEAN